MSKLAVVLMVKNEEYIVERCLSSILALEPNVVVITDTGSSDSTVVKCGLFLQQHNIPYKIYFSPFVDFGTNRSLLLRYAQAEDVDYVFMIDADEVMEISQEFDAHDFKSGLTAPCYNILMKHDSYRYHLPRLTSNKRDFKYVGVTHECLENSANAPINDSISIKPLNDSNRRVSGIKLKEDIKLLTEAIKTTEPGPLAARYFFYLAQSYQGVKDYPHAISNYNIRTQLGGWNEEVFYSYYQLGNIYSELNQSDIEPIIHYYLKAWEAVPTRVESLVALYFVLKNQGFEHVADLLLLPAINRIELPKSGLFLEPQKYVKR